MTTDITPLVERPTATPNDDGISQEAIDNLDKLWEAVGVRVIKGQQMLERIQMVKAVPQQVTCRHRTEPASTAHTGANHHDEDTVREHDEHASDLSHRND